MCALRTWLIQENEAFTDIRMAVIHALKHSTDSIPLAPNPVPAYVGSSEPPIGSSPNSKASLYRGTSPIRKRPPPYAPPRTLGIGLQ